MRDRGPFSAEEQRIVTVRAAAKINLHLGVGAPRPDGFHPLDTVYMAISLYDDVTAIPQRSFSLLTTGADHVDATTVPTGDGNLAALAARALARHHGRRRVGRLEIEKCIPIAGGMAGGSADAAAALVALDRLWGLETSDEVLLGLAADLGSDVPFALIGGIAHGTGRGEVVRPLAPAGTFWWVIVPSAGGLSTPSVYRRFDELAGDRPSEASPEPTSSASLLDWLAVGGTDPMELAELLHNDLQEPALDLRPDLRDLLVEGLAAGASRALVSGSGPTCLFLCASAEHAQAVAAELGGFGRRTVLVANGPVAGAHLVNYV